MQRASLFMMSIVWVAAITIATPICAQQHGPAHGALVISGGAETTADIYKRFIELAGGPDAFILVVPTSGNAEKYDDSCECLRWLKLAGARNLRLLHTNDRATANTEAFVAPLQKARGIWFAEGNSWRHQDAYLDTRVQKEIVSLLDRGGVVMRAIGGSVVGGNGLGHRKPIERGVRDARRRSFQVTGPVCAARRAVDERAGPTNRREEWRPARRAVRAP